MKILNTLIKNQIIYLCLDFSTKIELFQLKNMLKS